MKFAAYAKMYVALVGLLASAALGVTGIPTGWKVPLAVVVALAGAFAVWKVPNVPEDLPAPAWKSAGPAWEPYDLGEAGEYEDDYF